MKTLTIDLLKGFGISGGVFAALFFLNIITDFAPSYDIVEFFDNVTLFASFIVPFIIGFWFRRFYRKYVFFGAVLLGIILAFVVDLLIWLNLWFAALGSL